MSGPHVTVTLLPLFADTHPQRTLHLTEHHTTVAIGRTSKREIRKRDAEPDNAWFESRVMSRDHAFLSYSPKEKKITITDYGSTHGTFLNDFRLATDVEHPLFSGDIIRFGVDVDRGHEVFEAIAVRCSIAWAKPEVVVIPDDDIVFKHDPSPSTNSFSVPEADSDSDESVDSTSDIGSPASATGSAESWEATVLPPADVTPDSLACDVKDDDWKGESGCPKNEPLPTECTNVIEPTMNIDFNPVTGPTPESSLPSPLSETNPFSEAKSFAVKPFEDAGICVANPASIESLSAEAQQQQEELSLPATCYQEIPDVAYDGWTIMKPMFMRLADMAWGESNKIPDIDHERRTIHAARRCSLSTDSYLVDDAPSFQPCTGTEVPWEPDFEESDTSFHRMPGSLLRYWSVDKRRFWVLFEGEPEQQTSNWWWIVEKPQELLSEELKHQLATETEVEARHKYWIVRAWEPQMFGGRWCDEAPYWDPSFDENLLTDDESVDSDEESYSEYSDGTRNSAVQSYDQYSYNDFDGALDSYEEVEDLEGPEENGEEEYSEEDRGFTKNEVSEESENDADYSSEDEDRNHIDPSIMSGFGKKLERADHTDAVEVSKHVPEESRHEQLYQKALAGQSPQPTLANSSSTTQTVLTMTNPSARFPKYPVSTELPKVREDRFEIPPGLSLSHGSQYPTAYREGPFASAASTGHFPLPCLATSGKSPLKRTATEMEASVQVSDFSQGAQRLPESPASQSDLDALTSEAREAISSALAENVSEAAANDHPAKRVKTSQSTTRTVAAYATTAVVSALLGGLGTIAALAALPNDYFQ